DAPGDGCARLFARPMSAKLMQLLVNIDVPDLAVAEALYTQAFALTPARRFGTSGVELLGANAPLYLLEHAAGSEATQGEKRNYARHWTPVHLDVAVEILEPALERACRRHAPGNSHPRTTLGPHRAPGRSIRPWLVHAAVRWPRLRRD